MRKKDGGYHPAPQSEDIFDAFTILRNRVEQENLTVATRRALKIMDSGGCPPAVGLNGSGGAEEAVEDWSRDFDSSSDAKVRVFYNANEPLKQNFLTCSSSVLNLRLTSTPPLNSASNCALQKTITIRR